MKRFRLLALTTIIVVIIGGVVGLLLAQATQAQIALQNTPTASLTATLSIPTRIYPSDTPTPSLTASYTATTQPSPTNTLSTLVVQVVAVHPDVTLDKPPAIQAIGTSTARPTLIVPTPQSEISLIEDVSTPAYGWYSLDVGNAALLFDGGWQVFDRTYRSVRRHYMYADDLTARMTFHFLGAAVRVRYAKFYNYGVFQVRIDGDVVTTVDSYWPKSKSERGDFVTTDVFRLAHGWHTLEITHMGRKNPASGGMFIAIDGIDVYLNGPEPTLSPTTLPISPTVTSSPAPVRRILVYAAPPTVQPTVTFAPPNVASVNLTIAYDSNGNKGVDQTEGVRGMSVRLITVDTNQVVASGFTNDEGFIHLEAVTNSSLRVVVPFLNRYWDIPARSAGMRITLLIPPANQPGIIP